MASRGLEAKAGGEGREEETVTWKEILYWVTVLLIPIGLVYVNSQSGIMEKLSAFACVVAWCELVRMRFKLD